MNPEITICVTRTSEREELAIHIFDEEVKELGADRGLPREKLKEWACKGDSSLETPKQKDDIGPFRQ